MTTTVKMKKSRDLLYVRQKGERGVYVVAFLLLALYSLCMLLPLFMIFFSSFKDALEYNEQLFTGEIYKFPETFVFSNYTRAFKLMKVPVGMREVGLGEMAFHTFWMAITAATINCITQACVGYISARYALFGNCDLGNDGNSHLRLDRYVHENDSIFWLVRQLAFDTFDCIPRFGFLNLYL